MNYGDAHVRETTFQYNSAKYGGAIYSTKDSKLEVNTCRFEGNNAYVWYCDSGNDVYTEIGCNYLYFDENTHEKPIGP